MNLLTAFVSVVVQIRHHSIHDGAYLMSIDINAFLVPYGILENEKRVRTN